MTTKHIFWNPRIEENRQQATSWLEANMDQTKWRAQGKFGTNFVFTDAHDEFKFKLAVGDLAFVTTKTQEAE